MPNVCVCGGGGFSYCLWNFFEGFSVSLTDGKAQLGSELRFCHWPAEHLLPKCFCTLCCSTAVFWWNLRYLIWSTCCSVLPESMMRKIFFCHLFFVNSLLWLSSCLLCSALFCLFFCLSRPVFHFWWQAFFLIFLWLIFCLFLFSISPGRWEAVIFCL